MQPELAFLGVSPGETAVVAIAILILFGAKRMPAIARSIGHAVGEFRRAARDLSAEIMREPAPGRPERPAKIDSPADADDYPEKPSQADENPSARAG